MASKAVTLREHIRLHYRNQQELSKAMGVPHSAVSYWVACEWYVIDGRMYSPRRRLPEPPPKEAELQHQSTHKGTSPQKHNRGD